MSAPTWANQPQINDFWQTFDQTYLAELAEQLVAIGQYELGFRLPGTESGRRSAALIAEHMQQVGLHQVRQEPFTVHGWDFHGASLTLHTSPPQRFEAGSFAASVGTAPAGLTAELVDVGAGTAADYVGQDVRGKIALVQLDFDKLPWVGLVAHEAELHGAVGVVMFYRNRIAQHESGTALNCQDGNLRQTIPALHLSKNDGQSLAARLAAEGSLTVTLHCQATNQPQASGYNVVGLIPGTAQPERYLLIQAHYDSWFYGYWDNAIGVAGIVTIAKALAAIGYQPRHTILFVSPDAEEFGAPDSAYGWLYGCQRLIEAHPEWIGRMTCAFNIDTLAHRWQQGIQFIGPAEMLNFMRQAVADYQVQHFPQPTVGVTEQITPWTEVFNYTYFGIPSLQPRFKTEDDSVRTTVYHTQLDDASLVDLEGAAEILKLYGTMLILMDQQPTVPYDFSERVSSIRASLNRELAGRLAIDLTPLDQALTAFETWAAETYLRLQQMVDPTALNDQLRERMRDLLPGFYYTEADFPDTGSYEHRLWERDGVALERALACLAGQDAQGAIAALSAPDDGVQGGWYALNVSYPVYHRCTIAARNPARADLLWGAGRTIPLMDVWAGLHNLQDKARRGVTDFAPEQHTLTEMLVTARVGYQQALERLRLALVGAVA